jgi:hypothetical protein
MRTIASADKRFAARPGLQGGAVTRGLRFFLHGTLVLRACSFISMMDIVSRAVIPSRITPVILLSRVRRWRSAGAGLAQFSFWATGGTDAALAAKTGERAPDTDAVIAAIRGVVTGWMTHAEVASLA